MSDQCLIWAKKKKIWAAAQSSFEIKVNSEFHLQIKVLEGRMGRYRIQDVWSPVQSLCSLWRFVMACHLLVLVTVFHQVQSQRRRPPGDVYSTSCWPSTCPQSTGLLTMLSLCLVDQLPHLTNALQIICGALSQTEEKHPNPKYRWWRVLSQSLGLQ